MADDGGGWSAEPGGESPTTVPDPLLETRLGPGGRVRDGEATEPETIGPAGAVGRLAGRYRLVAPIGAGGMGTVYRAVDEELGRVVALKLLPAQKLGDPDAVARLRREARALARLSHPGIVQAFDVGEDAGRHFLVMEFVAGEDLRDALKRHGPIAPTRAADYAYQAADALQHAHEAGLVHRDLKPSNLILAGGHRIKVLDLGLARFLQDQAGDAAQTAEGMGMGTPDYMAPEQFRDAHAADPRSDVYSLGCTLYHLLTGRVPFPGSSLSEKARAHLGDEPTPLEELCPEIPAGLALAVARMMAKGPDGRFQSMREVTEALAPYVAGASETVPRLRETTSWHGGQLAVAGRRRRGRRRRAWLVAALASAASLVLAAAVLYREWRRPVERPAPPVAAKARARPPWAGEADRAGPGVLTVAADGWGRYRSIRAAIAAARPGQTVRILDEATYREAVIIGDPERLAGITLEAPRGATLAAAVDRPRPLLIDGVAGVTVRGFRFRVEAEPGRETTLRFLVTATGDVAGLALRDLDLQTEGGSVTHGINLVDVRVGPGQPPAVVERCSIRVGYDGIKVIGNAGSGRRAGGIAIRGNRVQALRGVWLKGALERVQIVGNVIANCGQAGLQVEDWVPGGRGILLANNTVVDCPSTLRAWETQPIASYGDGAIEVINNLMRSTADRGFLRAQAGEFAGGPELIGQWRLRDNWRDRVGNVPLGPEEHELAPTALNLINPDRPDYLRPPRGSPLADQGAGRDDPSLPRHVGAVPPEGSEPWDWRKTWTARAEPAARPGP